MKMFSGNIELFLEKVHRTDGCWLWTACVDDCGYGRFGGGPERLAHRISWIIHIGLIPDGKEILHKCDTPPCVRPEHLYVGTQADNMRDMMMRGRGFHGYGRPFGIPGQKGIKNPNSKLTDEEVVDILRLSNEGMTGQFIAKKYHVSAGTISMIIHNKSWGHICRKLKPQRIKTSSMETSGPSMTR